MPLDITLPMLHNNYSDLLWLILSEFCLNIERDEEISFFATLKKDRFIFFPQILIYSKAVGFVFVDGKKTANGGNLQKKAGIFFKGVREVVFDTAFIMDYF